MRFSEFAFLSPHVTLFQTSIDSPANESTVISCTQGRWGPQTLGCLRIMLFLALKEKRLLAFAGVGSFRNSRYRDLI